MFHRNVTDKDTLWWRQHEHSYLTVIRVIDDEVVLCLVSFP